MKTFGVLFLFLFSTTTFAKDQPPRMIYGADNRLDYYQVDPQQQQWAESTAIITDAVNLTKTDAGFSVLKMAYGSKYGLCSDEPFFDEPSVGWCSASLVAPDLVLTAGHCVSETSCSTIKFIFGYQVRTPGVYLTDAAEEDVVGCKEVISRKTTFIGQESDYAVVRLDRPITHRPPLPINRSLGLQVGDDVGVIGYPYGLPVKIAFGAQVRTADAAKPFYVANLDTYGGNSGSPVFGVKSGKIEGILVRGDTDFVSSNGCMKSHSCADGDCRGEDVTRISEAAPFIPAN